MIDYFKVAQELVVAHELIKDIDFDSCIKRESEEQEERKEGVEND